VATQQQIEAVLKIEGDYSLISGAATITDISNYAGIGIASPDTVKILLWIQDSTTATFYKNAGYDTANFASPDLQPLAGDDEYSFTLPTDITGAYLQGQYTINMKVQVNEGSTAYPMTGNVIVASSPSSTQTTQLEVSSNLKSQILNGGDIYEITYKGETISYTVGFGETINSFVDNLNAVILNYQFNVNPTGYWATELGTSVASTSTKKWLRINNFVVDTPFTLTFNYIEYAGPQLTNAFKSLYQNITASCNGIVISVAPNVTYNTAVVSVTDNTNYKGYTSLAATLTLYPPPQSGQASQTLVATGSPATLIYSPDPGTYPYTGVWTWTLSSQVTYTDVTGASVTCLVAQDGSFNVVQSQLCKVYCVLKQYRGEVQIALANNMTYAKVQQENLIKAEGDYLLAWTASMCGKPQTEIDAYIASIYALINKTPDCNCGCDDGTSQPLTPTSIINGIDGTDGTIIYSGNGVPAGNLGAVGDYYIDVDTGDWYKKTGASTWTFQVNLKGATGSTGSTGAPGAAGADGVAVLENSYPNASTAGTAWETLGTYQLPAAKLASDGSEITIRTVFTTNAATPAPTQLVRQTFNGSALNTPLNIGFVSDQTTKIIIETRFSRVSNTSAKYEQDVYFCATSFGGNNVTSVFKQSLTTIAGLNFTTTAYDIDADANSDVAGDITLESFEIIYYKK